MFTDFECPYCQKFHKRVREVQDNAGRSNLLVVFRNWALPYHRHSRDIAQAARCAGRSDKFWEFADWAFETAELYGRDEKKMVEFFAVDSMEKKAASLGVHPAEFRECMKTNAELGRIMRDEIDAVKFGGKGTPFIMLNGTTYDGNWMKPGELEKAISELAK
jgi:protein-disulfide isomerase